MAKKLFTVEEAAAMLGMPVDELTALREKGEVYAYKDGGVWKFREDEIERVKAEREDAPLDFGLSDEPASGIHNDKLGAGDAGSDLGLVLDSGIGLSEKANRPAILPASSARSSKISTTFRCKSTKGASSASRARRPSCRRRPATPTSRSPMTRSPSTRPAARRSI
jgi:excisionase family DNA binding protein